MSQQQKTVDLSTLPIDGLTAVKKQLDDELEHLATSFQKLRQAQTRFRECITAVQGAMQPSALGKPLLVPLTTSLFVPAKLSDASRVLVDVGTGYYVEKSSQDAVDFYTAKVDGLGKSLAEIEQVVQQKGKNVRLVEEVLRRKVLAANAAAS